MYIMFLIYQTEWNKTLENIFIAWTYDTLVIGVWMPMFYMDWIITTWYSAYSVSNVIW